MPGQCYVELFRPGGHVCTPQSSVSALGSELRYTEAAQKDKEGKEHGREDKRKEQRKKGVRLGRQGRTKILRGWGATGPETQSFSII